jgi:hypothetical protein
LNNLIYEDDPWPYMRLPYWERKRTYYTKIAWSRTLPLRMHIVPVMLTLFFAGLLLALAFTLALTQPFQVALFLSIFGATTFIAIAVGIALTPTKFQIFSDKIRIVLGYILHLDIPFINIENITPATWQDTWGLNFSFVNSFSSDDILRITRKHGVKVYITPWDRKLFLENLNKAFHNWNSGGRSK